MTSERDHAMTLDGHEVRDTDPPQAQPGDSLRVFTGRLVSLRYLLAALRRARPLWISLAILGLVIGVGYHFVVPVRYSATATLYLAQPAATSSTVDADNDLAMLNTAAVGNEAIALLGTHGKGLTSAVLLGKTPGASAGGNVLVITIWASSQATAVRRANAVADAYLTLRSHLYQSQNHTIVSATDRQITTLQAKMSTLDAQISALGTHGPAQQLAQLNAERATITAQIVSLQQSAQTDNLNTLAVVNGSRVITPGTLVAVSKKKVFALDGLSGLAAGLGLGIVAVVIAAVLSDRIRRREDLAALVGAPVEASVGRLGSPLHRRRSLRRSLRSPVAKTAPMQVLVHYLNDQVAEAHGGATLVVAIDDLRTPATALMLVAASLASSNHRVVLVDETRAREVGRALGVKGSQMQVIRHGSDQVTLFVPPRPWEAGEDANWLGVLEDVASADVVLVIASVDPAVGAWHLRRWATDAIVSVTAGESTAHRIAAVTELLDAADVRVSSAMLLNADPADESAGMSLSHHGEAGGALRMVPVTRATAT